MDKVYVEPIVRRCEKDDGGCNFCDDETADVMVTRNADRGGVCVRFCYYCALSFYNQWKNL